MAIEQGSGAAIASAVGAGILGTAAGVPLSPSDFAWFTAFAMWGIVAKHASKAAEARAAAKTAGADPASLPTLDWRGLIYDSMTAPFLGVTGWSMAYYFVLWMWKVPLDKSVLLPAAMASGFIGAEWIRFCWNQIRGLVSNRTGVGQ